MLIYMHPAGKVRVVFLHIYASCAEKVNAALNITGTLLIMTHYNTKQNVVSELNCKQYTSVSHKHGS